MYELLLHERTHQYMAVAERAMQDRRAGVRELLRRAWLAGHRARRDGPQASGAPITIATDRTALLPG